MKPLLIYAFQEYFTILCVHQNAIRENFDSFAEFGELIGERLIAFRTESNFKYLFC